MLKSLSIDNIAVTRHLDVDFPKGYTAVYYTHLRAHEKHN